MLTNFQLQQNASDMSNNYSEFSLWLNCAHIQTLSNSDTRVEMAIWKSIQRDKKKNIIMTNMIMNSVEQQRHLLSKQRVPD